MSSLASFFPRLYCAGIILFIVLVGSTAYADAKKAPGYYGHGETASASEIAGWDIDVRPDGTGLPIGKGTVEDGEIIYDAICAECHGSFGEGEGRFPVLAGGEGTLQNERPTKTVGSFWAYTSTLWDYVHRTMPFTSPESLDNDEVYAVVAYVLYLNELVEDDFELNQDNLASVEMPNKGNFTPDPRPDVDNKRCMKKCKKAAEIKIVSSVAPLELVGFSKVRSELEVEVPGERIYEQNCAICHRDGLAGAPIVGDSKDWKARQSAGMLTLKQHAVRGFQGETGLMPPKGGFSNLSDQQVGEAVEFMVDASH